MTDRVQEEPQSKPSSGLQRRYRCRRRSPYNPTSPAPISSNVVGSGVDAGDPPFGPLPPITPTDGAVSGASLLSPGGDGGAAGVAGSAGVAGVAAPPPPPPGVAGVAGMAGVAATARSDAAATRTGLFSSRTPSSSARARARSVWRSLEFAAASCPAAATPSPPPISNVRVANPTVNRGALAMYDSSLGDELVPTRRPFARLVPSSCDRKGASAFPYWERVYGLFPSAGTSPAHMGNLRMSTG